MAITNITATVVNGVQEITVGNNISTTGGATDESILMYGVNANVRAIGTGDVTFTRCNFYILSDVTAVSNPSSSVLSYNGDNSDRTDNDSFMRLIDTQLIFDSSGRKNIFLSELTRSKIIHQDSANGLYIYTPPDAILEDVLFNGTQTWEIVGVPSIASGIKLQDVTYGFLNWEAGRLDFLYIEVSSNTADAWLGNGNSGNNQAYMWNSVAFDNTKIRLQNVNGTLYEGNTASWRFIDQETLANVDDVLVIYDSDFSGSRTELGRYTTNTNGLLQGTYDSQNDTTGADIERPTLFVLNNYTDQAGSDHSAGGGFTYSNIAVTAYVEIRSYLYDQPSGYSVSDSFSLTDPIGGLAPDYTVSQYELFRLMADSNLTELNKTTVLAYASLDTPETLYDRAKAEWRDNDNFPLISRNGSLIDLGAYDIDIDATALTAYAFSGNKITIKSSNFVGDMITTGLITLLNGAIFTGTRTDANGTIAPPITASITGIHAGSRLRIYNNTAASEVANEAVAGTSYSANYIEGVDYTVGDSITYYLTQTSTVTAKTPFSQTVVATASGWSAIAAQDDDPVYNSNAVDGSTITNFTADYTDTEVDIIIDGDWTSAQFYAWWAYNLTTENGIRNFFGGVTAQDVGNFLINNTTVNIKFDTAGTGLSKQVDNARIYRADAAYPVKDPTTGGGSVDIVWREKVLVTILGQASGVGGGGGNQSTLSIRLTESGKTITGTVYDKGGSVIGTPVVLTDYGNGIYSGAFPLTSVPDGEYHVVFTDSNSETCGQGSLYVRSGVEVSPDVFFNATLDTVQNVVTTANLTTNNDKTGYQIDGTKTRLDDLNDIVATDVTQAEIESGYDLTESLRLQNAVLLGKASKAPNATVFRDIADTKDRVISKTDDKGNRSQVTLDES